MRELRDIWESTSFALELEQANPKCVEQERLSMSKRTGPQYQLFFKPAPTSSDDDDGKPKHRVAVIREEGSNGDREMAAAFVRGVRARSARISIISLFRVSVMSLKLQEYHSYRSLIPCKKINARMHTRL